MLSLPPNLIQLYCSGVNKIISSGVYYCDTKHNMVIVLIKRLIRQRWDNIGWLFEEELLIPAVIILLRSDPRPLIFYDVDPDSNFLGISEESFSNSHFLKGGFISLPDEDGEQNYIPVTNIDCLEVDRAFIYPDDMWEEMENMRKIENNKN